jgi:ADP-dependent NAD(P)H-hydrate dehydratase / NAD(P)H-hydrate epimerase
MKIITAAEMQAVDQQTIALGFPSLVLMENAAHRVVEQMRSDFGELRRLKIAVVCGKGNNGGDGLAIARILSVVDAADPQVVLAVDAETLSPDAQQQWRMWQALGGTALAASAVNLNEFDLIVDALLGTGARPGLSSTMIGLIDQMNQARTTGSKVVAVDLPSGLLADQSWLTERYVRADLTVTFTAWKRVHVLGPSCHQMGRTVLRQIGTPHRLLSEFKDQLTDFSQVQPLLQVRQRDANKGNFGHVLIVAGSRDMSGAAALTTMAALRIGAGLVTAAVPKSVALVIRTLVPEVMVRELPETDDGHLGYESLGQIEALLTNKHVLAIGPGLGQHGETQTLVKHLFQTWPGPAVFDADALNALSPLSTDLATASAKGARVLTPHPGEMSRLSGDTVAAVQQNRWSVAKTFAQQHSVTLLLKGDRTIVADNEGVQVNPTGTPAMAKAGSGDILTGMLAGLWAQNLQANPKQVAAATAFLHGYAGEKAEEHSDQLSVIATDLLRYFPLDKALADVRGHA